MRGEDKGKTARGTLCREGTDFTTTPGTKITAVGGLRMARTERRESVHSVRRESHHQQGISIGLFRVNGGWSSYFHHEFVEMLLVESYIVGRLIACFRAEFSANRHLRCKPNNPNLDVICN